MNEILENKEMKIENKSQEIQDVLNTTSKKIDCLLNPKIISKAKDVEWRQNLLNSVKIFKNLIKDKKHELFKLDNTLIYRVNIDQQQKELEILKQDVDIIFKKIFFIKDQRVKNAENEILNLQNELKKNTKQVEYFKLELDIFSKEINKKIKEKISQYYEKIDKITLTKQEKKEFLTSELLENLSTWEYIQLWKKLNPYFMSHVTRQGYRDHAQMIYHTAWIWEFTDWFKEILRDDKMLRPPINIWENGLKSIDEAGVKVFLEDIFKEAKTKEEALEELAYKIDYSISAPKYADKTAVHFAWEDIANWLYWAETWNEVFVIYPSDVILSQYAVSNRNFDQDFTKNWDDHQRNDIFVWWDNQENPWIPIDSWIVFLPLDAKVDKITGSKYIWTEMILDNEWYEKNKYIPVKEENAITSKEYWECYFSKEENKAKKPAHIIYYSWEPKDAIKQFLSDNNISEKWEEDKYLWFEENYVQIMENDSRSNLWYNELRIMCEEIISKHYEN